MDRKGPRGVKSKNAPLPGSLITLGNKVAGRSDVGSEKTAANLGSTSFSSKQPAGQSADRGRDLTSSSQASLAKKSKTSFPPVRPGPAKPISGDVVYMLTEEWENIAEEVDPTELIPFIESAEDYGDTDRIDAYLCGTVKSLKAQRAKPDSFLCFSLMYLVKMKSYLFNKSDAVVEGYVSLLKRDSSLSFKTKGGMAVPILAANVLLAAFQDEKNWPEIFVRVYIEDSLGERAWVDHEDCKGFADNIITAFQTKMPPKNLLYPELGAGRTDCPSPPVSGSPGTSATGGDSCDENLDNFLECRESLDVHVANRFSSLVAEIEETVMEAVQHQLGLRHQTSDLAARNFTRFLSSVCGISEVRRQVAPRLEIWLQNPKLQRPATELLMSLCLNCHSHSAQDVEVISHIVRIRLKHKQISNQYQSCLRELLAAHAENISSVLKYTLYNELSQARNPSNMSIVSVVFQFAPEHAAVLLADEFQELLCNREDFLRALRALLREIVRTLRYDMQYYKFSHGLFKDRKDTAFREGFEFKDRMFHSVADLVVLTYFMAISPQVKESATMFYRGERKDLESLRKYQELISCIQKDAMHWMCRIVPKCYNPNKEEFTRCLNKLLMFDQAESYYMKDNWPIESDRPLYFRLSSEVPLKQETLVRLLTIAAMKDQWIKPQELLDIADKLVKRATSLNIDDVDVLKIEDVKVFELVFNLCPYLPPENSLLPSGYRPPKTAIATLYWKAWMMMLLVTAHNPGVFGLMAWESYPTLRALMEMCITNSFVFPPPTLVTSEKGDDITSQELQLCALERQQILDFESHLAQKAITEQNSLLLSQLITMDPTGPARRPPVLVLDQLKLLNASHKIGHLLCRSRNPDFLVDIIQRQGASQSMPWLADLVQSSEGAFSVLPVQCLCEFLLSEAGTTANGASSSSSEGSGRHHQLLQHLRSLLRAPRQEDGVSIEILDYFLRRLSSQLAVSRAQALRGLQLVVAPLTDPMDIDGGDYGDSYIWLLQQLPNLPGFSLIQSVASQALRAACQIETDPFAVSAYIRFLAEHTHDDSVQEQADLVQDMAQLIVERCTMISAILPAPDRPSQAFAHTHSTLRALLLIFLNYIDNVRLPAQHESFTWSENQDQVRIQWSDGEQAVMHILVVHAMVILLTYGPDTCPELFHKLLYVWFPERDEMPQAYLVDTSEEALLLPDWLKLKMIRSTVPQLVDAAVKDLEPSQLVLFIQSFGIPVASMTKLLVTLDVAVRSNEESVAAAVLDKSHKTYMAQLVEVQHQRGAKGGHAFAATLGERDDLEVPGEKVAPVKPMITHLKVTVAMKTDLSQSEIQSFILQCFTDDSVLREHRKAINSTMRSLQRHFGREIGNPNDLQQLYVNEFLRSIGAILQSQLAMAFVRGLHDQYSLSAPLFRMLHQLAFKPGCEQVYGATCQLAAVVMRLSPDKKSPLSPVLRSFCITDAGGFSTGAVKLTGVKANAGTCADVTSKESIMTHLSGTTVDHLEEEIRNAVGTAIRKGQMVPVVSALSQLLTASGQVKEKCEVVVKLENGEMKHEQEEKNKTESYLNPKVALLLDWMQVLDPELEIGTDEMQRLQHLFGCQRKGQGGQSYLLAAFIHEARWDTLERTARSLLKQHCSNLDPSAVLGFVWAVLRVPKLWQGRDRHLPRHSMPERLLTFSTHEVMTLSQYVIAEQLAILSGGTRQHQLGGGIEDWIPLVLHCMAASPNVLRTLVNKLAHDCTSADNHGKVSGQLLYHLYLRCPKLSRHVSSNLLLRVGCQSPQDISFTGRNAADVSFHTLITMLASPKPGRDFRSKMADIESALRGQTWAHPLLALRHLPLLAAALNGKGHLQLSVLNPGNVLELYAVVLRLLELLQPLVFGPPFLVELTATLDSFMALFEQHTSFEDKNEALVKPLLVRFCNFMEDWVGCEGALASAYLASQSVILTKMQSQNPELNVLRSLVASVVSTGYDSVKEICSSVETNYLLTGETQGIPQPPYVQIQLRELQVHLATATLPEERADVLRKLGELADRYSPRAAAILSPFVHELCDGISNSDGDDVRTHSWQLLAKLLMVRPAVGDQVSQAVLAALSSCDGAVVEMALERLSDIVLLLQGQAAELLTAAFTSLLTVSSTQMTSLTEALTLLHLPIGA